MVLVRVRSCDGTHAHAGGSDSSQGIGKTHRGATKHPCQRTTLAPCQRRQEDRRVSIGLFTECGCFTNFPVAQKSPRREGQGHLLGPAVRDATPLHDPAHDPSTMRRHLLHRRIHQCGEVLLLAGEVANDHNIDPLDVQGRSLVPGPHQPHATDWTPVAPSILMHDPHARCTAILGNTRYLSPGRGQVGGQSSQVAGGARGQRGVQAACATP